MAEVIGVRFKNTGKVYYFDPGQERLQKGEMAIVETARGVECGEVAMENREVSDSAIVQPLRRLVRRATPEDLQRVAENRKKEKAAFRACEKRIASRGLEMKLVEVEYTFDNSKILFYFTADGRVDFRELVKDLAGMFHTRIELNPTKISGTCGRLMCCLKYEQEAYQDLLRTTPKVNALVSTPEGKGVVIDTNLLTRKLTVRLDKDPDAAPKVFHADQVKVLRDGRVKIDKKEIDELKGLEK